MTAQKLVLVVDDDPETRGILGAVLTRQGLTVDFASEGTTALDLIREKSYAVVMLDLLMPGTNGFAVLDRLNGPGMPSPVVLVISGADRSEIDKLDTRKVHGIVRKPFDPDDLASIVLACADIRSRRTFETMAVATMIAGGPLLDLLQKLKM